MVSQWSQLVTTGHTLDHLVPSETSWPHIAAVVQVLTVFEAFGGTGTSKTGICEMIGGKFIILWYRDQYNMGHLMIAGEGGEDRKRFLCRR